MKALKEKIAANRRRQVEEAKQKKKEAFAEIYDRTKVWKKLPINKINMDKFFFIMQGFERLPEISFNALAVYPCLCSQANFEKNDWFQISQNNIAEMAGISINSVMAGINDLLKYKYNETVGDEIESKPILVKKKETDGKRHYYIYHVAFVRKSMIERWGNKFIFHTCIIDSGIWRKLSSRAKALYLAMRSNSKFNAKLYSKIEGITFDEQESLDKKYRNRKWDVCNTPLAVLCRMVGGGFGDDFTNGRFDGMSSSNIHLIVKQLEDFGLIEKVNNRFMVYLKPKKCRNKDSSDKSA